MPITKHEFLLMKLNNKDMRVDDVEISDLIKELSDSDEYISISDEAETFYKDNTVEKYVIKGTFSNNRLNKKAEDGEFTITFENYEEENEEIQGKIDNHVNCIIDWIAPHYTLGALEELTIYIDGIYGRSRNK